MELAASQESTGLGINQWIFLPIRNEWLVAVGFPRKAPDLGYLSFSPGDVGAALQAERGGRVKGVPLFPGFEELAHTEHTRTCLHCLRFFFSGGEGGLGVSLEASWVCIRGGETLKVIFRLSSPCQE